MNLSYRLPHISVLRWNPPTFRCPVHRVAKWTTSSSKKECLRDYESVIERLSHPKRSADLLIEVPAVVAKWSLIAFAVSSSFWRNVPSQFPSIKPSLVVLSLQPFRLYRHKMFAQHSRVALIVRTVMHNELWLCRQKKNCLLFLPNVNNGWPLRNFPFRWNF